MWAVAYAYDFSRRTSVGLTYAKINNDEAAFYNLWNSAALQQSTWILTVLLTSHVILWTEDSFLT